MSTNRKRRYSKLSLEDKVRLLSDSDNGLSHRSLAAKFRISKGKVTNILKRKKEITKRLSILLSSWEDQTFVHNIKLKVISGEYASVDEGTVNNWKECLFEILKCYEKRNVFNCDETGLLFRTIPNKTLAVKNDKCKGSKLSKERLTVLLASSMTGKSPLHLLLEKARNHDGSNI
ncbi:Tigger transposable element-derived protein 4 [Trichinella papuae]|uniref:Tigger transposable element-derived protein 4 n=1 Tax=Trichinella papuae TaxID=268474 RepID=A0A0V1N1K8_9BILA|nr:Tigger transposable element-derived protein 4 [Trichinella papuae]